MNSRASKWHERRIRLAAERGLHVRPAQRLAELAAGFDAELRIAYGTREADAASIMDLMTLGAPHGSRLTLRARGPEAEAALDALQELLLSDTEPAGDEPAADR